MFVLIRRENDAMSTAAQVTPGQRDPHMPRGLILVAIAALVLGTLMYVLYPGHGPIQGHVSAPPPASSQPAGKRLSGTPTTRSSSS